MFPLLYSTLLNFYYSVLQQGDYHRVGTIKGWTEGLLISLFNINMAVIFYGWCLQMIGFGGK